MGQPPEEAQVIDAVRRARALVDEQAEDEALWFVADSVVEAYFQQELRRLHAAVEAIPLAALAAGGDMSTTDQGET